MSDHTEQIERRTERLRRSVGAERILLIVWGITILPSLGLLSKNSDRADLLMFLVEILIGVIIYASLRISKLQIIINELRSKKD